MVGILTMGLVSQFGWQLTDKEDLLAMACLIVVALLDGVLLLCNHWSVNYHETICYKQLAGDQVSRCTHVKVRIENRK